MTVYQVGMVKVVQLLCHTLVAIAIAVAQKRALDVCEHYRVPYSLHTDFE